MPENIYGRYCKLRDSAGYKDSDVARGAGITKSTFSDWKSGRYIPKQVKLQKIADFLQVSLDFLMTGEESLGKNNNIESEKEKEYLEYAKQLAELGVGFNELEGLIEAVRKMKIKD
ncbi:helix-turn-helix domain-containing protein [Lacrimispora sp.]|jgi:transcriptional regulator with XRE-family HTH domain|uniref:helix-turn-helix domain-containing protein n=1 Tax=Lacrimispora sp. TaxID=2719234 RepID=UPI00289816EC|nr:helix-turn-helix transcriptional regulator [Lacrimispora sp.]